MSYIDVLKQTQNVMTPGSSACQGCGGELILRRVMQIASSNCRLRLPEPFRSRRARNKDALCLL